jgi:hypothetical protein
MNRTDVREDMNNVLPNTITSFKGRFVSRMLLGSSNLLIAWLVANCVIMTGCGVVETDPSDKFQKILSDAKAGNSDAQYEVGRCYLDSNGVAMDEKQAAKWFFRAAERGDFRAQGFLASTCVEGRGVPVDLDEAIKWWRRVLEKKKDESGGGKPRKR